jgi:hypothetical protein
MEKSTALKLCGASFVTGVLAGWYLNKLARKVMPQIEHACFPLLQLQHCPLVWLLALTPTVPSSQHLETVLEKFQAKVKTI